MAIFQTVSFQAIQAREKTFAIYQNAKQELQKVDILTFFFFIKTRSSKSRKIDIFPKGLTHGFGPKMAIFPTFFLGKNGQEIVLYDILERKIAFLGYKNKKFKTSKNFHFSKGINPWFWSINGHFSNCLFHAIKARKISFTIFYNGKSPFQAIKTRNSKSQKIFIFPFFLGLVQRWPFFQLFLLCNKGYENIFYDILERKIAFLGYKNKKFKKSKNFHFSKGVKQWFWSKNGHFSNFFFLGNKGQQNVFYDILKRKIAFLGYKNKNFKKPEN